MLKDFLEKFWWKWYPKILCVLFILAGLTICIDHKEPLEGILFILFTWLWYSFWTFMTKSKVVKVKYDPKEDEKLKSKLEEIQ